MKTPIEELIETFENALQITVDEQTKQIYLEKEKQVIIEAWENGRNNKSFMKQDIEITERAEQYYKETFNKD